MSSIIKYTTEKVIDQEKTARDARKLRAKCGQPKLTEIADEMKLSITHVHCLEKCKRDWNEELAAKYEAACNRLKK